VAFGSQISFETAFTGPAPRLAPAPLLASAQRLLRANPRRLAVTRVRSSSRARKYLSSRRKLTRSRSARTSSSPGRGPPTSFRPLTKAAAAESVVSTRRRRRISRKRVRFRNSPICTTQTPQDHDSIKTSYQVVARPGGTPRSCLAGKPPPKFPNRRTAELINTSQKGWRDGENRSSNCQSSSLTALPGATKFLAAICIQSNRGGKNGDSLALCLTTSRRFRRQSKINGSLAFPRKMR
jgi:hypothetical protein